jgi:alkylation response protein AidB-like acyl-CoA dehydrogenase
VNFDFSPEQELLREEARKFLSEQCPPSEVRVVLDGDARYHAPLWKQIAELGWLGTALPEAVGGQGAGALELCVLAEELGRSLAPVPIASSIYLGAEFLLQAGSAAQQSRWLPKIADGSCIATYADRDGPVPAVLRDGALSGNKRPVPDGDFAHLAVVRAGDDLALVELNDSGVERFALESIDPTRGQAELRFSGAAAERLGAAGQAAAIRERVYDRAAVFLAFEQLGGAIAALEMGRDYAVERFAFGRPIGSFQAIKHMLADMFVSAELARSNCYYGAWALSQESEELPLAAATARIAATQAYQHCSKNNIQVHGGMGFTWEFDCHLYYRRSKLLALLLGSETAWKSLLVDRLVEHRARGKKDGL